MNSGMLRSGGHCSASPRGIPARLPHPMLFFPLAAARAARSSGEAFVRISSNQVPPSSKVSRLRSMLNLVRLIRNSMHGDATISTPTWDLPPVRSITRTTISIRSFPNDTFEEYRTERELQIEARGEGGLRE